MKRDSINEELIVGYLLGDLPEEKQSEVEDRAFQDEQYLQEILAAESDLIDEYVRGELSGRARQQFESRFLASAERLRRVGRLQQLRHLGDGEMRRDLVLALGRDRECRGVRFDRPATPKETREAAQRRQLTLRRRARLTILVQSRQEGAFGSPRRRRMTSTPSSGSSARTRTASGTSRGCVTTFTQ